jgi:hypothetical protein
MRTTIRSVQVCIVSHHVHGSYVLESVDLCASTVYPHLSVTPIQTNPSTIPRRTRDAQALPPRRRIAALHPIKLLNQPTHSVRRQIKRKLLPDANPWPTVERQESPTGAEIAFCPTLRYEIVRVLAVHVFSAMHGEDLVPHMCAFRDGDWRHPILTTTDW